MAEHADTTNWTSELAAAARESVNYHRRVADVVEESNIAAALKQIAERRERLIAELDQAIWRMDKLTGEPDTDLESLRDLKLHFEAFTHLADTQTLLRRCQEANTKLSAAADDASRVEEATSELAEVASRLKSDADQAFRDLDDLLHRA